MKSSQFQVLMDLRRYYIFIQRNNAFTSVKAKQKKKERERRCKVRQTRLF